MEIVSFSRFGYGGEIVKVETDLRRGIPATDIVGLPDGAVREAKERVRAAIRNSSLEFPRERILISLSPADLKKEGSAFDLAIALSVLTAQNEFPWENFPEPVLVLGELELSGAVRRVRGTSSAVAGAAEAGIRVFLLPGENRTEAGEIPGARIFPVSTLAQAYGVLQELCLTQTPQQPPEAPDSGKRKPEEYRVLWPEIPAAEGSLDDVEGQETLVRALTVAAAGGHHTIVYGPPGCGKTMAVTRFRSILPKPDAATAATILRIRSIAGISADKTEEENAAMSFRPAPAEDAEFPDAPFRAPHPNCSLEGMAGGGKFCQPGEISLAHGGVLFLDETALFKASVLQALRAPMEAGHITLSRAGRRTTFPARFQLLAAMNPCPCGKFGVPGKICTCTPAMVEKYWQQLTEPVLDRLDLRVEVPFPAKLPGAGGTDQTGGITGHTDRQNRLRTLRSQIARARLIQWERNRKPERTYAGPDWLNACLTPTEIPEVCILTAGAESLLQQAAEKNRLSGRSVHSLRKTARTIADLDASDKIHGRHMEEALFFRTWSPSVPDFL